MEVIPISPIQGMQQLETSKAELEVVEDELEAGRSKMGNPLKWRFSWENLGPSTRNGGFNGGKIIWKWVKSRYKWVLT